MLFFTNVEDIERALTLPDVVVGPRADAATGLVIESPRGCWSRTATRGR